MHARLLVVTTLALVASSATPAPARGPKPPTPGERVLARVNQYRRLAGLPNVELDATASAGCMAHANYMKLNRGTDAMAGLRAHKQDPSLPGASAAGAACGRDADLFPGVSDLDAAVDGWMAGIYHRRPMLVPELARIGVGYAELPDHTLMAALVFVREAAPATSTSWPVAYPADGGLGVPLEYANEVPNPIPGGGTGGYPITLQFPPFDKVTKVSATLVDGAHHAVPFYLSDPEHPATSFGQYGVISVIPRHVLAPATTYSVSITATWGARAPVTRTWSFTTVGLVKLDATDEAGLVAAQGKPSRVRGVVLHGGMMDSEHAFLQIGNAKNQQFEMVSVILPRAVWIAFAQRKDFAAFVGQTVEVDAAPRLVAGKYLNLSIAEPTQLRIVN